MTLFILQLGIIFLRKLFIHHCTNELISNKTPIFSDYVPTLFLESNSMNSLKGSVERERKLKNSSEPLEIRVWPTYLITESTENAS